ncbi:MAG: ATPase, T2SS/T4P/T4SS family [Elusimicrobiota bacterium]
MTIDERPVDLRISTVPTYYGEKVVMRLLDKKRGGIDLEGIVTDVGDREALLAASNAKQGMVLVTGPTGSGKTTTLYGLLGAVKSESKNIVTLEDPVEYLMEGINQIQVNPLKNVTFATGLRSILRQDPNVILVGEIRDRETADAAFRAAQTGHLVFSTLHTKSTTATIARLMDIGLEPYQIATSLTMVVAQRLLRRICPKCKEEHIPDHIPVGAGAAAKFYRGKGCADCDYTGYQGRFAVQEMLHLDDGLRGLIARKASEEELAAAAQERGMRTLGELALAAAAAGRTTLEEAAELMDAAVPAEQSPPPATPDPDRKPRILAVDDEADILTVLSARLRQAGYEVLQARNGKEAVEAAVREKPDLLVMDVMMPEMDGFEATRVLRSRLQTAGIPIMLLTAMQGKEGELTGLDAGADDYVNKPFDKEKLLARVKMLLRRRLI